MGASIRALLLAVTLAGCQSTDPDQVFSGVGSNAAAEASGVLHSETIGSGPVLIAALLPLSAGGASRAQAAEIRDALVLATRDLGGDQISLKTYDTGGRAEGAVAMLASAARDGAKLIIGLPTRAEQAALASAPPQPPIIALAEHSTVAQPGVLALVSTEIDSATAVVEFAVASGRPRIVAVAARQIEESERKRLQQSISQVGGKSVGVVALSTAADLTADARRDIAAAQAILVMSMGGGAEGPLQILKSAGLPSERAFVLGTTEWSKALIASPLAAGAFLPVLEQAGLKEVAERMKSAYGRAPTAIATHAYDSIALAAGVSRTAGPEAMTTENLRRPSGFRGATGKFRFEKDGSITRLFAIYQVVNGRIELVDPAPEGF